MKPKISKTTRRRVLKTALVSSAGVFLGAGAFFGDKSEKPSPVHIHKKRELIVVTSWPKNSPFVGTSIERLAKSIEETSDGSLRFRIYASGELVPPLEVLDAVSSGAADAYHSVDYYFQNKSTLLNFFTGIPFGMLPHEHLSWLQYMGGQQRWEKTMEPFNIHPTACGASGIQMLGWFKKPLNGLDDIRGLKIRTTGLSLEIWKRLGAAPVLIPGSDVYFSLQSGKIDAAKWITPWTDFLSGFHQVASYYYYPGFTPTGMMNLGINKDIWHSLSKYQQAVITTCALEEYALLNAEMAGRNAYYLNILKTTTGVSVLAAPDVILHAIKEVASQVVQSFALKTRAGEELYQDYSKAIMLLRGWDKISQGAFLSLFDQ